ncbi:MAG: hypothetical protein K940chlam3_01113 [Chlamydiae bacterium]|nr:hypothetical protein [Chlamydiota bacterium]
MYYLKKSLIFGVLAIAGLVFSVPAIGNAEYIRSQAKVTDEDVAISVRFYGGHGRGRFGHHRGSYRFGRPYYYRPYNRPYYYYQPGPWRGYYNYPYQYQWRMQRW